MKKLLVCLFTVVLCLCCFSSCNDSYEDGVFFSDDMLSRAKLVGIPRPDALDKSVLKNGEALYLNLTTAEYGQYVTELVSYLLSNEGIYYLGYSVGGYLLAEIVPYDKIAPITDSYNAADDVHEIFFSLTDELDNNGFLHEPVKILIKRSSGKLEHNDFAYNTEIRILSGTFVNAEWDLCGAEHTYDEGTEYKIPGSESVITKYACVHCGSTRMSDFIGDMKYYNITIEDNDVDHYIIDRDKEAISGVIVSLKAHKLIDAELKFIANGTEIIPRETEDGYLRYEFIMPCADVLINVEVVGGQ